MVLGIFGILVVLVPKEYDLEFNSPKRTKALELATIMKYPHPSFSSSPITFKLPDEFLFVISMKDPWYGICEEFKPI